MQWAWGWLSRSHRALVSAKARFFGSSLSNNWATEELSLTCSFNKCSIVSPPNRIIDFPALIPPLHHHPIFTKVSGEPNLTWR